jgi:hypothetical protein
LGINGIMEILFIGEYIYWNLIHEWDQLEEVENHFQIRSETK